MFLIVGAEELIAIADAHDSPEAQQVNEGLTDEKLETVRRLLQSGIAKSRAKAFTMTLDAVGFRYAGAVNAAAAIGTAVLPGIGTAIAAGIAGIMGARKRDKDTQ
jgi:hypothetical protein